MDLVPTRKRTHNRKRTGAGIGLGARTLRRLRESARLTQGDVEVAAKLGEHYLKRIELGQVARPQRATLERILDAVGGTYNDQRLILEAYGYAVLNPLPNEAEIAAACRAFHDVAATLTMPAQLLDCAQRLHTWNALLGNVVDRLPDAPESLALAGKTIIELMYDPQFGMSSRIANVQEWGRYALPALLHELRPYIQEPWCRELLRVFRQQVPGLDSLLHANAMQRRVPGRPLLPVVFRGPADHDLSFWMATELFIDDARFRIVYYMPADEATHRQCQNWVEALRSPHSIGARARWKGK